MKKFIDDFAKFVARNGTDSELMAKHREQRNPNFSFLFGGNYCDYYRHKLGEERSLLESTGYSFQSGSEYLDNNAIPKYTSGSNQFQYGYDFTQSDHFRDDVLNSMNNKLNTEKLNLQIMQEEHIRILSANQINLNENIANINKEKEAKCMPIVDSYRLVQVDKLCREYDIDFFSMEMCIQAILTNCTKDNICSGKNWVIDQCNKKDNHYPLSIFLLSKVSSSSSFISRLHIIYFINDLLHHCKRKNPVNLIEALESIIVPIYSLCVQFADEVGKTKLNKVLSLWEANAYTKKDLLDSMRQNHDSPELYLKNWYNNEINVMKEAEDEGIFQDVCLPNNETISGNLLDALMRISNIEDNNIHLKHELKIKEESIKSLIYHLEQDIKVYENESHELKEQHIQCDYNSFQDSKIVHNTEYIFHMPDISKPPPELPVIDMYQFDNVAEQTYTPAHTLSTDIEMSTSEEIPTIPYWRSPAALMVLHIRLSSSDYIAIDTKDIKMPQLNPPSRYLVDLSNKFYQLPSPDKPRDPDGWERLALHDFLKAKEKTKSGEMLDNFVSSLHVIRNDCSYYEYGGYEEDVMDYYHRAHENVSDFKRNFPPPGTFDADYKHKSSNQRSLLGSPWNLYSRNVDAEDSRLFGYSNIHNRPLSHTSHTKIDSQKVVPLMSLGMSSNKRNTYTTSRRRSLGRNSDDDSYDRQRTRPQYLSRSRSYSRSRSRSASYSRSRSRSYSRSYSRSRSRSSQSSRSSYDRPHKGGFIARKRTTSRNSRSLSRSPVRSSDFNHSNNQSSLMPNLPDRRVWSSGMRCDLIDSGMKSELTYPRPRNDDPFSRFRRQRSFGYNEGTGGRVVRRSFGSNSSDNF